jgi:hypothetical protein
MTAVTGHQAPVRDSGITPPLVGFSGWTCRIRVRRALGLVLTSDVNLIGLEDEIGAALPVAHESSHERGAEGSDSVHVLDPVRRGHACQQVIELSLDQLVLAGQAHHCTGQLWRGLDEVAIQPGGTGIATESWAVPSGATPRTVQDGNATR